MAKKEEVLKKISEEGVKFIRLQVTDINGTLKNVEIPADELENSLKNGTMFDGSSIEGFVRIEESDMILKPDIDTFCILPWTMEKEKVARFICDVYTPDGKPFPGDPRRILRNVTEELAKHGYTGFAGPEPEFFLLPRDEATRKPKLAFMDEGDYFDLLPIDLGEETRKQIVVSLEEMGLNVEASHHEAAPSQHEIDFTYADILKTADNIQTFKLVVKTIALLRGLHATFMPKPFFGINGSGMHVHMSLFSNASNIFFSENSPYQISNELRWFVGGIFNHIDAITAIANPSVNSYKRLVPGYEAPVNIAWSASNRTALVRVPASRGKGTRVEFRSPDATSNPYLLLAVVFACGLDGIINKNEPHESVNENIYLMTEERKKELNIRQLPQNLQESIDALKKDSFIKGVMGEHVFSKFIQLKEQEHHSFSCSVTDWEIKKYLHLI